MDTPVAKATHEADTDISNHDTLTPHSQTPSDTCRDNQDRRHRASSAESDEVDEEQDEDEEYEQEDEENEEPRLKYAYLTKHLGSVYRNGDATSTFVVAGDKMVCIAVSEIHVMST